MKKIALYEAKNRLSELCNQVAETREPFIISRRGKPIVKIVPADPEEEADSVWASVEESKARYGDLDTEMEEVERSTRQRPDPLEEAGSR